jgi:glycine/D-amino acid oxidase-like deaminating enzyme
MEVTSPEDVEVTVMALSQTPSNHFLMAQADRPGKVVDSRISHAAPKTIATMVGRFIPALRKARVLRTWTAPTTYTDDGCPLLGPIKDIEGLILATAYRSSIIHAPLAGEIVSQLVTANHCDLIDIAPFTPERKMQVVDPFYSVKSKTPSTSQSEP